VPELGVEIDEAQVTEWLKGVGERVAHGEPVVVIATPKATLEIEAPASGIITGIAAVADEIVKVGATLGTISTD
jgi:pyruvate dehydrogenase E2 component (dihydrolipoamide acetyltransferase)